MAIEVIMPQIGETVAEGVIVRWLKKPGEQVQEGEPLVEVETDKAMVEVPSPASGHSKEAATSRGAAILAACLPLAGLKPAPQVALWVRHVGETECLHGATFSITNPGAHGAVPSTPIINQPQAAILSVETIAKMPVVVNDAIAIRSMMYLCLSYDHRIIDGAVAVRFLQAIRQNLEDFQFLP